MLPIRTKSIFRSRWIALLWAAGIIWMAVDFAGGQSGRSDANGASNADVQATQDAVNALSRM